MKSFLRTLGAVCALALASDAAAVIIHYKADLSGLNEIPPVLTTGSGTGDVYYDTVAHTLEIDLTWSDLVGTTTVAHIHAPATAAQIAAAIPFNGTWGVATQPGTLTGFPTGLNSGSYDGSAYSLLDEANFTTGFLSNNGGSAAAAEAALIAYFDSGKAYINIHSGQFPGGEIKGYLVRTPELGATAGLLALSVGAMGALMRRKRA